MKKEGFAVSSAWAPRDQSPSSLALRFIDMIARLQTIHPMFMRWRVNHKPFGVQPLVLDLEAVTELIMAGVGTDDDGNPEPLYGYSVEATNGWWDNVPGPQNFRLSFHADPNSKYASNSLSLSNFYGIAPDAAVMTFEILREVLLAFGETFGATDANAWPNALADLWPQDGSVSRLPIAWISYVGPRYAHLVTPPASAIVERRPDGGLFMAATGEPFSVDNPAHMAVAREIEAAVAPFNALPRPLEDVEPA